MRGARVLVVVVVIASACTRAIAPVPVPSPGEQDSSKAAGAKPTASAQAAALATPQSPFFIVARTGLPYGMDVRFNVDTVGYPLPLVERTASGGIVVASEYARASAGATGPLRFEYVHKGLDADILSFHEHTGGWGTGVRWARGGGFITLETEITRAGPRLALYRLKDGLWSRERPVGFDSATVRGTTTLALERGTTPHPHDAKPGRTVEMAHTTRARIAVLAGRGQAPTLPAGFCPHALVGAPDDSLLAVGRRCDCEDSSQEIAVVRFAPGAMASKVETFDVDEGRPDDVTAWAGAANDLLWGVGQHLHRFDGKAWSVETIGEVTDGGRPTMEISSISKSKQGDLYVTVRKGTRGEVLRRASGQRSFVEVPLPSSPREPLDRERFEETTNARIKDDGAPASRSQIEAIVPVRVDATEEEVLVLGMFLVAPPPPYSNSPVQPVVGAETVLLSTKDRGEAVRLPSAAAQRGELARIIKRRVVPSSAACSKDGSAFVAFAEGTTADALRGALKGLTEVVLFGEATVEGKRRMVAYDHTDSTSASLDKAARKGSSLSPQILCGLPVIEKKLELDLR